MVFFNWVFHKLLPLQSLKYDNSCRSFSLISKRNFSLLPSRMRKSNKNRVKKQRTDTKHEAKKIKSNKEAENKK